MHGKARATLGGDTTKAPSSAKADSVWEQLCSGLPVEGKRAGEQSEIKNSSVKVPTLCMVTPWWDRLCWADSFGSLAPIWCGHWKRPHCYDSLGGQLGLLRVKETLHGTLHKLDGLHLGDPSCKG